MRPLCSCSGVAVGRFMLVLFVMGLCGAFLDIRPLIMNNNNSSSRIGDAQEKPDLQHGESLVVTEQDRIYYDYYHGPVVIESHKLVFFLVQKSGTTLWKHLFSRMMGYSHWAVGPVHGDYNKSGLLRLSNYSLAEANEMMTSPNWTRAIFVRDPKERLLSAYMDKMINRGRGFPRRFLPQCCRNNTSTTSNSTNNSTEQDEEQQHLACLQKACESFPNFISLVESGCQNEHWGSQHGYFVQQKHWPWIDFVGHMEMQHADAKALLERIGAWEEFGKSGWGPHGNLSFSETDESSFNTHATRARDKLKDWYTTPDLEKRVEQLYEQDYKSPYLNLTKTPIYQSLQSNSTDKKAGA